LLAVSHFLAGLDLRTEDRLRTLADAVEDGPVLAELLRGLGKRALHPAIPLLLGKVKSKEAVVRAAAVEALAALRAEQTANPACLLLADDDPRVRSAAALAVGVLGVRAGTDELLRLARDADADVRRSSLDALRRLREPRALPIALAALDDTPTTLRAL